MAHLACVSDTKGFGGTERFTHCGLVRLCLRVLCPRVYFWGIFALFTHLAAKIGQTQRIVLKRLIQKNE